MAYLLTQLLTASAERDPDKAAVWADGRSISYRELEERSNQLARLLCARGVKKGDRVGIYFPKAVESVICMFGVLKAAAVYVPMDTQQPVTRAAYLTENCAMKALLTAASQWRGFEGRETGSLEFAVLLDGPSGQSGPCPTIGWDALATFPTTTPPGRDQTTLDLAYMLYTSGSTGRPKGVMISHGNALTFIEWCAAEFQIGPDDRLSNHAPLHFDLSVFDIYNAIEAGATVYMVPQQAAPFPASLANFIETQGITVWYSVPSALVLLIVHAAAKLESLRRLRLILFAGEVFAMKYLQRLAELLPRAALYNLYGPTETNVCTYYRVDPALLGDQVNLPIGKACANTEVFAVNDRDELVQTGETGELYVRGPGVTCGYWGDPEKTGQMVVPNRFQPHFSEKMYRTGDIVTLLDDGNYAFVGRRDSMIKSRGYRIELGEIEAALLSHPGVREAIALPLPDEEIGARIKAVVAPHGDLLTPAGLLQHCSARIPKYMVPEFIEFRDSLPKTSSGKVDRVRLASEALAART